MLATCGVVMLYFAPELRPLFSTIPSLYGWHVLKLGIAVCFTAGCGLRITCRHGLMTTSFLGAFTYLYILSLARGWSRREPFFPHSKGALFIVTTLMCLSLSAFLSARFQSNHRTSFRSGGTKKTAPWVTFLSFTLLLPSLLSWITQSSLDTSHPIDLLIHNAEIEQEYYIKQASASETLADAAKEYYRRYYRPPPPGFDIWFEYALNRSSLIIDDFDNIQNDLLPFWALSPVELRNRVWQCVSKPGLMLGGIRIRNGKAEIANNVAPTHKWMLEGIIMSVEHFSQHIPDMDIAFNLNDEPRVAVPFDVMEGLRQKAFEPTLQPKKQLRDRTIQFYIPNFSPDRAKGWRSLDEQHEGSSAFTEASIRRTFYDWGSVGCPPSSRARRERHWDPQELCIDCSAPQRLGAWVANWSLAGNVCHQPDLANFHGFYLSPAAFAATHDLMPVFSQSKAFGFNDILYPSAWNYLDKVKYNPSDKYPDKPFEQKENTLFWRGQTSEGVSPGNRVWNGMVRQRLVNVATNASSPQPLLLPYPLTSSAGASDAYDTSGLRYQLVNPEILHQLLKTDVRFVPDIIRCGRPDCEMEALHFGFGSRTDFQEHWKYTYLYDGDGAGFSGRFIPFLQSRSLPFKSALFREWWEGRLTPWRHFVPLDLRLHDLWATLAYFSGLDGNINGKHVKVERKLKEGRLIAEQGREWANKVLRKEDMEVYLFRLLLEWGRLTDDKRDELGFLA